MPVQILGENGNKIVIADYGIRWGDSGAGVPTFERLTNLMLDLVPHKPILIEHGDTGVDDIIGASVEERTDPDIGVYVVAEIDGWKMRVKDMLDDLAAGKFGWSASCFPNLYQAHGNRIARFPVLEWTLTRYPRDWRNLGVKPDIYLRHAHARAEASLFFDHKKGVFWLSGSPYSYDDVMANAANHTVWVSADEPIDLPGFKHHYMSIKG